MMMYYNNNSSIKSLDSYAYDMLKDFGKQLGSSQKKSEVKPIEYAFKDEVDYLKRVIDRHDNYIDQCLQAIEVNRKDCEQMYQAIDILKHDLQEVQHLANYLYDRVGSAPSVAKRKRKVTICAGGQRVEVCR